MKLLLSLCFALFVGTISAQTTSNYNGEVLYTKNKKNRDTNGSPYSTTEFIPAKLDYLDKTQFIRFNVADDIVELKSKEGKYLMLDLRKNFSIELLDGSDISFFIGAYRTEGAVGRSFFELIIETESYSLFKKERKKYIEKEKVEAFKEAKPAKFSAVADLFYISDFKSNSKNLLELPRKKKKFIAFFDKQESDLAKFMKQEKLDFKKQEDLIHIINFVFFEKK